MSSYIPENSHLRTPSRLRLLSERLSINWPSEHRRGSRGSRWSTRTSVPFLADIDIFINGGFEPEEEDEVLAEIQAIDHEFVPPVIIDEDNLTEDEIKAEKRKQILKFVGGCLLAFTSGLVMTVNNFVIKWAKADFGEIMAVRAMMQIPVMLSIIAFQGDLNKIFPEGFFYKMMAIFVGIFGSMTTLTSFACLKFMPVGDAMTLIFTNPLFTMIFAAVFLGHRLTCIKNISALILFAGIILVTKPPFLFPEPSTNTTIPTNLTLQEAVFTKHFILSDIKMNWTEDTTTVQFLSDDDQGSYYFVGAIVALGSAIFCALNNILTAKIGDVVPVNVQLLYMGFMGVFVAISCQFMDDKDRFFTSAISEITAFDWCIATAASFNGLFGFFCATRSLTMIPPSTVATLRTLQIFVAFIAQIFVTSTLPSFLDILGAVSIFFAALAITFEKQLYGVLCFKCRPNRPRTTSQVFIDESDSESDQSESESEEGRRDNPQSV